MQAWVADVVKKSVAHDWRSVALGALMALYGAGLAVFPPPVALVSDEAQYVRQAVLYAQGLTRDQVRDAITGNIREELPSTYPPGTSLLQTPFVRIGGWAATCWASFAALCALTFFTAQWLRRQDLPTSYAALIPLFLPTSVLGRTGMSDLPSAAIVVTSLFCLGLSSRIGAVIGGFLAGASLLFRDSNPIFLVPSILRRLVKRDHAGVLILAGVAGVSMRLLLAWRLQGQPVLIHGPPYPFTIAGAGERALIYAFSLVILVPGGLVAAVLYRGERWVEVLSTVVLVFIFFSLYSYSGQDSGFLRSFVLAPRYMIPLVSVLALAIAGLVEETVSSERLRRGVEVALLVAAGLVTCTVHPLLHHWAEERAELMRALYAATSEDALLVTEPGATAKYLNGLYGPRTMVDKREVPPGQVSELLRRGPVQLVFVDREDSDYWRTMARLNEQYLEAVGKVCTLRPRTDLAMHERLRVLDIVRCQ